MARAAPLGAAVPCLALATLAAAALLPASATARPPSFVVFLADDMGFSDLSSYGGEIATPAIDRIGRQGVRCRSF